MPEKPPSSRPHPPPASPGSAARSPPRRLRSGSPAYAELLTASNFSFLRGASHPEELAAAASVLGLAGFSIADRNSLAGIVRGHLAAKQTGAPYAVGCRLVFRAACSRAGFQPDPGGTPDVAAWAPDRASYGRLCRLLTTGNLRAKKGECHLDLADLLRWGEGLELAVLPGRRIDAALGTTLAALAESFPGRVRLGAACLYHGEDRRRMAELAVIAHRLNVPLIALGDVLYHAPERRRLQDVLSSIREGKTLESAGRLLEANAERHMKSAAEMARLFAEMPNAVTETLAVFERLRFSLDELRY